MAKQYFKKVGKFRLYINDFPTDYIIPVESPDESYEFKEES